MRLPYDELVAPPARIGIRALRTERPWQGQASRPSIRPVSRSHQPHATRPIPESRFIVVGGRVVAVVALVVGLVTAGSVALR